MPPATSSGSSSSGFAGGLGAGAVGGGIIALLISYFGIGASPDQTVVDQLQALTSKTEANESAAGDAQAVSAGLEEQVTTLSEAIAQIDLEQLALIATNQASIDETTAAVAALQEQISGLGANEAETSPAVSDGDTETPAAETSVTPSGVDLAALEAALADLQATISGETDQKIEATSSEIQTNLDEIAGSIPDIVPLQAALDEVAGSIPDVAPMTAEIGTLAAALAAVQTTADGLAGDLGSAKEEVAVISEEVSRLGKAEQRAVGTAIAIFDLDEAVANGGSPDAALSMLEDLAQDNESMSASLEVLKGGPIPTMESLAASLSDLAGSVGGAATGGDSVTDQVANNLSTLFSIKDVDQPEDPAEAALLGAMSALSTGDIAGAISSAQTLVDSGIEAASTWIADAERHVAATEAMTNLKQLAREFLAGAG